ncbi:MAG: hypothetical protein M3545_15175 [Acidobacteriota bacterium]|nr:hypothetical protein [Acidobacteriota bacterium]
MRRQRRTTALGPSLRPEAAIDPKTGYPKNDAIVPYLERAIEYKEVLAALTAPTPVI